MDGRHPRHRSCTLGWWAHCIGLLDWYGSPVETASLLDDMIFKFFNLKFFFFFQT